MSVDLVLMFNFDLFWDTSYPNVIVCCIVLPTSHLAVFSLCSVNKRSIGNKDIISIKVIKILVSLESSCMLTTSTSTGVKKDICCSVVNGY